MLLNDIEEKFKDNNEIVKLANDTRRAFSELKKNIDLVKSNNDANNDTTAHIMLANTRVEGIIALYIDLSKLVRVTPNKNGGSRKRTHRKRTHRKRKHHKRRTHRK